MCDIAAGPSREPCTAASFYPYAVACGWWLPSGRTTKTARRQTGTAGVCPNLDHLPAVGEPHGRDAIPHCAAS